MAERRASLLVNVTPSAGWDCTWPRVGVRFDLPAELRHASWFGTGPNESYPDTRRALRVGRFAADIDELNVAYSRPQETGHRSELRELVISDARGPRLSVRRGLTSSCTVLVSPSARTHRSSWTARATRTNSVLAIMSTCSSMMLCTGSARAPVAWTYCPSMRSGRARGNSA